MAHRIHLNDQQLKDHFRSLRGANAGALESVGRALDGDHKSQDVVISHVEQQLRRIVDTYLDSEPELQELVGKFAESGAEAWTRLDRNELAASAELAANLEAIVRTDGTRPSFLIVDGKVDIGSSPAGDWGESIVQDQELLTRAIKAVGRIDMPASMEGFQGTGFLVAPELILTNRHVLQTIAVQEGNGWRLHEEVRIDFGHEFRGRDSVLPRQLKSVISWGPVTISPSAIDHQLLDLALIELAAPAEQLPLAVEEASDWARPGVATYLIGYPANPGLAYPLSLLERLFQMTWGAKRLAPGTVVSSAGMPPTTVSHDATTLGGNSGSVMVVAGRESVAAALHYGGRRGAGAVNWGHGTGPVLDLPLNGQYATLRKGLLDRGGCIVNRTSG